jgi:hypothetical protein
MSSRSADRMQIFIILKRLILWVHWRSNFFGPSLEVHTEVSLRLLARVLKEAVQFWYNDTSTVKSGGGGLRNRSSGKPLKFTLLHVSICSKLVRNFSNTIGFVIFQTQLAYLTTTSSFSQVHHQIDQNVKCIIIMRIEANSFRTY